jgi:hypothetical protein
MSLDITPELLTKWKNAANRRERHYPATLTGPHVLSARAVIGLLAHELLRVLTPHPKDAYHENHGHVLWLFWDNSAAHVGTPLDSDWPFGDDQEDWPSWWVPLPNVMVPVAPPQP